MDDILWSSRRDFLKGLALVLVLPQTACVAEPGLSESDRLIASLGRKLAEDDPETAARLARLVAERMPALDALASAEERARAVRQQLLVGSRLAAEFDAGDVIVIDGWMLARSEATAAVYLDLLVREVAAGT